MTSVALARLEWPIALASSGRSARLPVSTSRYVATISCCPYLAKSETQDCWASKPSPLSPCFLVLTR